MDILTFLNTLERTLNNIEIKGRENIDRMAGCFYAIDKFRNHLIEKQAEGGNNTDGRQTDITTDGSNDSN